MRNLLRFSDGELDESENIRFDGRVKLPSGDRTGHSSSPVSSGPEENVSDGVGERLRNLLREGEEGDTRASLPYTSSAWDLIARNAVFRSVSRGL